MKIRFQADYDFNGEVLDGLLRREPAIDLKSGHAAGLEGVPDPTVLEQAAKGGFCSLMTIARCLFTLPNSSPAAKAQASSSSHSKSASAKR